MEDLTELNILPVWAPPSLWRYADYDKDTIIAICDEIWSMDKLKQIILRKWPISANYTKKELAAISYLSPKISRSTHPMLYWPKWTRLYTSDLMVKMEEFFDKWINKIPNKKWIIEKTDIPTMSRFRADNWITSNVWNNWLSARKKYKEGQWLIDTMELAMLRVEDMLYNWVLQWIYNAQFWQLLAKNWFWLKDTVEIKQEVKVDNSLSNLDKMSEEQLRELLASPEKFTYNNDDEDDTE